MANEVIGRETLLSASQILLFGRIVEDLEIKQGQPANPGPGKDPAPGNVHNPFIGQRISANNFLEQQIEKESGSPAAPVAHFARIYGFTYEGYYYELPWPALFMVNGDGEDADLPVSGNPRASRAPGDPSRSGAAAQDYDFADNLKVWSYDRADFSMRLDVESGTFEQILLDVFLGGGGGGVSGARVSGARVSGARVSGARVSGARVSGARVSGARVSGARVSGSDGD